MNQKTTKSFRGGIVAHGRIVSLKWMPVLMMAFGVLLSSNPAAAQFVSNGTGGGAWTSATTWAGSGGVPPSNGNVTIAANDSVWTSLSALVQCGSLDIQSGAKLNVIGFGILMSGDFSIEAGALYINNTDSAKAWPAGATGYTIDPTSTFELGNGGNSTLGWSKSDSTFGNVVVDANTAGGITCGANLTIQGNLTINAGQGKVFRGMSAGVSTSTGATSFVHHVMGNVTVVSGNWSAVDMGVSATVPLSCTWDIDGNVTVGDPSTAVSVARFSPVTSEDDLGAQAIFNIKGNFSLINGGRLAAGSNSGSSQSPSQIAALNIYGDITFDPTATFGVNSMGNFIINFKGTKPQTVNLGTNVSFSHSSGPPQCSVWDTVAAGSNVTFTGGHYWASNLTLAPNGPGAFVVNGTLNFAGEDTIRGVQKFILSPGGTLGIGSQYGIVALSDPKPDSGNVQVDSLRSFSPQANYVFNGVVPQIAGSGFPTTVNNLTINDTAGVTLGASDTVAGTLTFTAGKLLLGSNSLFVSNNQPGAVAGGDTSSYVVGSLTRAQGTSTGAYAFPIGAADAYHGATLNFTTAPSAASNLTVAFTGTDPTSSGLPAGITGYWPTGYWTVSSSGTPGGTYDLSLLGAGVPGIDTGGVVILRKAALADAWVVAGNGTNVSGDIATGKGVTGLGVFGFGYGKITGVLSRVDGVPTQIALANFPNPFNPTTQIQFAVPKNARVTLTIYNDLGQKVASLVDGNLHAGVYQRVFDGSRYASGMYFARLTVGDKIMTTKMLMIK